MGGFAGLITSKPRQKCITGAPFGQFITIYIDYYCHMFILPFTMNKMLQKLKDFKMLKNLNYGGILFNDFSEFNISTSFNF